MSLTRRSLLATVPGLAARAASPTRPHIVLFLADDHGYWDSPIYGSRAVRMPNLERLAARGMTFTHAFTASPTCVPSRSILMSGLYPARNGALPNHSGLRAGVKTLPSYLKELGYHVAHFGKSHFQPKTAYPDLEFVPSEIRRGPLTSDLDPPALDRWLAQRSKGDQPLCLVVCSHSPHVYWPENEGYDPAKVELPPTFADTPETRAERAKYYTDITNADRQLGEVLETVNRHLGDSTLFLYTSDNGAQWPFAKWSLFDAGIRLPFVAAWPGVVKPGSRTEALVSFCDLLPTCVEFAGGGTVADLDGRSFAGVLRNPRQKHRADIFAAHSGDGDWNVFPMRAVRTTRHKYIRNLHPEFEYHTHIDLAGPQDGKTYFDSWVAQAKTNPGAAAVVRRYHERPAEELYDTVSDPHETRNLAADPRHARLLADLRDRVTRWMAQQGDVGQVFGKPRLRQPAATSSA